jgi:HNH endonuclease
MNMGEFKLMSDFWQAVAEASERDGFSVKGFQNYYEREMVWLKGAMVPGQDPSEWRRDAFGSLMLKSEYGNCLNFYGWEIDHIVPLNKGGSDLLNNKQPLQWSNNRRKADKTPTAASLFGLI